MKKVILFLALVSGPFAAAHVQCAGELNTGGVVTLTLETGGPMGSAQGGFVSIKIPGASSTIYAIKAGDIAQYFEDLEEQANIWAGTTIYVDGINPVSLKYRGQNYSEGTLVEVLADKRRVKQGGNAMRTWKGPGYPPEEQYSFKDVVCSAFVDQ